MIRVAFGSVPKDGGTFTFYRNLRLPLLEHQIDLRCVSVGAEQAALVEPAFVDDGCVLLAEGVHGLKRQARIFCDWCAEADIDVVFGVNSPAILSALPHLPEKVRVMARCANGFDEGYRLTLMGQERLAKIVALVPRLRDDLIANYRADPRSIALIPNGASVTRFQKAAETPRGRDERLELAFLGRLEHTQKGVFHLPPILDRLGDLDVPYRLTIAGKGKHEAELRTSLAERVADGRVTFVGTLSPTQIPAFLSSSDVFLFTSHFEGCPNALLEAMMAGTVPVSWRLPGITDFLIDDERTGLLCKAGDTMAMAEAVSVLHRDRKRLVEMSGAVAQEARQRFSNEVCTQAYVNLFGEAMRAAPPVWSPISWSDFRVDPMFRSRPVARLVPPKLRSHVKSIVAGLRPARRLASLPAAAKGLRVHQIINSIDLTQGGAERIARRLHQEMRHRNIDARLVALQDCDVSDIDGAISLGLKSPYDPRAVLRLGQYAKQIEAGDVVHVHLFPTSAHVSLLARTGKIRGNIVFTEHNSSNRRRSHPLGNLVDRNIYPAFQRVIAISEGVERELVDARPSLSDRTLVIQNGCPLHFDEPLLRDPSKSRLKIVSVGRLVPAKNFPTALRAVAKLRPQQISYTIAGSGPELDALQTLSHELGIADRVSFAGHVDDVPALLRSADIFLIPSLWEGFGLAAVEAMNASLPVIASDVAGLRDVVGTDEQAAFLIDSVDTGAIADRLQQLVSDASLRAKMGRNGFERSKVFDYKQWVTSHLELYHNLAEHGANAA